MEIQSYQTWLKATFIEKKRRNPLFSLRAFARSMELSPTTLSQIISGKRPLTMKQAKKIACHLSLSAAERSTFFQSLVSADLDIDSSYSTLKDDEFNAVSQWYHFAILALGKIKSSFLKPEIISRRFFISQQEATAALQRLANIGAVQKLRNNWTLTGKSFTTSTDVPSIAIKNFHAELLTKAGQALFEQAVEQRDFSGMTIAIDKAKLPEAKRRIEKFRRELAETLQSGQPDAVYHLGIQLFSLDMNTKKGM